MIKHSSLSILKQLVIIAFSIVGNISCKRATSPSNSIQQPAGGSASSNSQSLNNTKPTNASYQGLSDPVSITMEVAVGNNKHVQVSGNTNLPPGTKLQINIIENRPDEAFGPGDKIEVKQDCTFQTRWISAGGNPFSDGRYRAELLMPLHSGQPPNVQSYFGESGSLLIGPLVEQVNMGDISGKVVRSSTDFVIGNPDDTRAALEVAQEQKLVTRWVRKVSEFKLTLREYPSLLNFRQNKAVIESMEADYLKEMDMIRQQSFKVAILSVMTDLRVMAQASNSADFDLQLNEYWRSLAHLEMLMKNARY